MSTKPPPTLLILPAEIRQQIWDYFLVSPTHRVLPVHYPASSDSTLSPPVIWTPTRPLRRSRQQSHGQQSYAAVPRSPIFKTLHFVPCAPTTAALLSPSLIPLAHPLPLVNRQVYAETCASLLSSNTLVLPDYGTAREVLAYLGEARLDVQSVEMLIGNVWDRLIMDMPRMVETLDELGRLVREGLLRKLRLVYVDGREYNKHVFQMWRGGLLASSRDRNWGLCEREVVWEDDKKKTDRLRELLARQWGLEGGIRGWDDTVTWEDWEPPKR